MGTLIVVRWCGAIAIWATACGPASPEAVRCARIDPLLDTAASRVELADTTGDSVPEAWIFESTSAATIADGLVREADGRFVPRLHVDVEGSFRRLADVDGDARDDLVVQAEIETEGLAWRVYGSDSSGVPGEVVEEVFRMGGMLLDVVDLDADGLGEFVFLASGELEIELGHGGTARSSAEGISSGNARVLPVEPGSFIVTTGEVDSPGLGVFRLTDGKLELLFRGEAPNAFTFVEAATRRADGRAAYFTAARRGELVDLLRVDIDLEASTSEVVALAEGATGGRAADLDGDNLMDLAWIDAGTTELRARFGQDDDELGPVQSFPEIGPLERFSAAVDLEGTGSTQLVVRHAIDEDLVRYEAIALDRCGSG